MTREGVEAEDVEGKGKPHGGDQDDHEVEDLLN